MIYDIKEIPENLREYFKPAPQIGLERTPDEYVAKMVEVFREVRRVLRDDGTLWLNIGDSYAGSRAGHEGFGTSTLDGTRHNQDQANLASRFRRGKDCDPKRGAAAEGQPYRAVTCSRRRDDVEIPRSDIAVEGIKPKDMVGIPWMLAFALRADGWWLRQDIIWAKPNPIPESVRDRCTKAHEYLFLLSKSQRYYYDADSIAEACESGPSDVKKMLEAKDRIGGKHKTLVDPFSKASSATNIGQKRSVGNGDKRNKRSVWEIATQPFSEAHFATFPTELVKPCILAGCPKGGVVLDPFSGSGTTLMVAEYLNCQGIGIELNPEYIEIAKRRLRQEFFDFHSHDVEASA